MFDNPKYSFQIRSEHDYLFMLKSSTLILSQNALCTFTIPVYSFKREWCEYVMTNVYLNVTLL